MMEHVVYILASGIGCAGVSLIFNAKKGKVVLAAISSMVISSVYIVLTNYSDNLILNKMLCAMLATAYAEIISRVLKAPSTVFLLPSIIPLVPGGSLYFTMSGIINGDNALAKLNANNTIESAVGIGIGIVIVSAIVTGLGLFRKKIR